MADQKEIPYDRLPGKVVFTKTAPSGKLKCRGVACGDFMADRPASETYAGGIDARQPAKQGCHHYPTSIYLCRGWGYQLSGTMACERKHLRLDHISPRLVKPSRSGVEVFGVKLRRREFKRLGRKTCGGSRVRLMDQNTPWAT